MSAILNADEVDAVYRDCLFREGELSLIDVEKINAGEATPGVTITDGIMGRSGLSAAKLEFHKDEIIAMLHELPTEFLSAELGGGGGWSFLNACMTRDGDQWTGFHVVMDQLFQLGQGVGAVQYLLPREMWSALPGGMPYLAVIL